MKVVFFLASLSQPRCIKRIKSLHDAGYDVEVYGYYRGFYDVNVFPESISVINWGNIKSGEGYFAKFIRNIRNILKVVKSYRNDDVLFYAFGFDLAFVVSIFCKKRYIYESSDLLYTYFHSKYLISFFKKLDKIIIRRSYYTCFTSEGFARYLYPVDRPDNIIIQPNRVSPYFRDVERIPILLKQRNGLVFSYIGAFRSPNTVFRFARLIGERYPQHKFYFYGDSNLTYLAKDLSEKYSNIKYFGSFKSPEDLQGIYKNIDVVVACYDTKDVNEQIADPNKLYEAICFCKPIVVTSNSFLADQVNKLKVGFTIDAASDIVICDFLDRLTCEQINEISLHEASIDSNVYIDSAKNIIEIIKQFK